MIRSHVRAGEWTTLSRGVVAVILLNWDGRMVTADDTTAVVAVEVDWVLGWPLLLQFRVPQAMRRKLERRDGQRRWHFGTCATERV